MRDSASSTQKNTDLEFFYRDSLYWYSGIIAWSEDRDICNLQFILETFNIYYNYHYFTDGSM